MRMKPRGKASRATGLSILALSIFLFLVYSYFLLSSQWGLFIMQITVLVAVAALAAVMAWIGFTMARAQET